MQHTVQSCQCESACHALLRSGLFPTSPSNPRQAISVELLDLFLALTARSSDAVTAMAAALNATYRNRGFIIANAKVCKLQLYFETFSSIVLQGKKVKEPFRKGLGYALQWYDCVRIEIERLKENAIASKFMELFQVSSGMDPNDVPPPSSRSLTMQDSGPAECLGILQSRCAACFGGKNFGRPLEKYAFHPLSPLLPNALISHQGGRHPRRCGRQLQPPALTIRRHISRILHSAIFYCKRGG